ncbi:toxin-antitoxin system, antitoxin component, ribbon-helix-helix domain protein [Achromobacter piechaudii ATCC 43553]|uniref:Toxin-antitoxin system, antitoxin component, ribbon-helix-helix domain protein n=1 Tax=Achromobacter piechaudii ATCC 43553 TaxID=742159 RepID=D4XE88_9BURK|nr:toxin-antitoxin system, antitoxin component, ribbon-helix-helix domain protein [Achromobacter piechaudii ATCC 43553]
MHFLPLDICIMPMLTVRNISEEVHRALRLRAVQHGRSTEAEVRAILEEAVKPDGRVKLGSLLAQIGRQAKITDKEAALFTNGTRLPPRHRGLNDSAGHKRHLRAAAPDAGRRRH